MIFSSYKLLFRSAACAATFIVFTSATATSAAAHHFYEPDQIILPTPEAPRNAARVVTPHLCADNTTQYSGYLPGSSLFFWFFPSRSDPARDPIGIWSNGGPGSSALTGMQYAGPCEVVRSPQGGYEMQFRKWSLNQRASILMVDNPSGAGFSFAPFPAVHSIYDSAKDLYEMLQSFLDVFPEFESNPLAINSLSYGGHYAPAYSSYIQHMNAKLSGKHSLWDDIWPMSSADVMNLQRRTLQSGTHNRILNLTSISVGNGWINKRVQYPALLEFACEGDSETGVQALADPQDCDWARRRMLEGLVLLDGCRSVEECVAASQYTEKPASFPYEQTSLNPYDYRRNTSYDETGVIAFYNNATVQAQLGVIGNSSAEPKRWQAHSPRVQMEYVYSGDWNEETDVLFERLLRSGLSILMYQGMVDWICNYHGVRQIMSNLPNYAHQDAFNNLSMSPWTPQAQLQQAQTPQARTPQAQRPQAQAPQAQTSQVQIPQAQAQTSQAQALAQKQCDHPAPGAYKCFRPLNTTFRVGNLCYLELEGAGHIASLDKPKETSLLLSKWMHDLDL